MTKNENSDSSEGEESLQDELKSANQLSKKSKGSVNTIESMEEIFLKKSEDRTLREKKFILKFLKEFIVFFRDLQDNLLNLLSEKLEPLEFKPGETSKYWCNLTLIVILKGDDADCMYILYSGTVALFADRECT